MILDITIMSELGLLDLGKTQEHQKPFQLLSSQKRGSQVSEFT